MKTEIHSINQVAPRWHPRWSSSFSLRQRQGNQQKLELQRGGFLQIDLVVGLAILSIAILPLGFSFAREHQLLKSEYCHSVANEIVDGEMEILLAGAAKDFPDGVQKYPVHSIAAAHLPPGHFQLTKNGNHLRLEWMSDGKHGLGLIVRETTIP